MLTDDPGSPWQLYWKVAWSSAIAGLLTPAQHVTPMRLEEETAGWPERQVLGSLGEPFVLRRTAPGPLKPQTLSISFPTVPEYNSPAVGLSAEDSQLRERELWRRTGSMTGLCSPEWLCFPPVDWESLVTRQGLSRHTKSSHVGRCLRPS